MFAFT